MNPAKPGGMVAAITSKSAAVIEMRIKPPAKGFADLAFGLAEPGDLKIAKSTWGAFFRADLDAELRRRGIRTIVLGGVATQIGVESTARQAWELGHELIIVRDATTSMAIEPHKRTIRHIFPRIARVADSEALRFASA